MMIEQIQKEMITKVDEDIRNLLSGPFSISEVLAIIEDLVEVYAGFEGIDEDQCLKNVLEIWEYVNSKYGLIDKLDSMITLPTIVEPFDSIIMEITIKKIIIPMIIGLTY